MTVRSLARALVCLLALVVPRLARAESPLDVGKELRKAGLDAHLGVFEDSSRALQFEQVAHPDFAARFRPVREGELSFGYSDSVYWLRIPVENSAQVPRSWLLELAFPHLDYVTLHVPRADGGYDEHETGDMLPFEQRDFDYRNFIFPLEEPPGGPRVYFLRLASAGSMTIPLSAWTTRAFVEHQHLDWAALCVFYGVLVAMTLYNACLYVFTRQAEYAWYTMMVLSTALFQLAFVGHMFQYVLPDDPQLTQLAVPVTFGFCLLCNFRFAYCLMVNAGVDGIYLRIPRFLTWCCAVATLAATVLPVRISLPLMTVGIVVLNTTAYVSSAHMWLKGIHKARTFVLGQMFIAIGAVVGALRASAVVPTNFFTLWSLQIGCSISFVLLSSALADKLNVMRAELGALNRALRHQVGALEGAIGATEQATRTIEQTTRVKDEFMATMSHELRTPLNAIINIPQGLLEQLPVQRYATCASCGSHFELDPGESCAEDTPCPECHEKATLSLREVVRYTGQPARTAHYLHKIERSGMHLLQVVNGILDASQIAAGHLTLAHETTDVVELTREVIEQMSDLAERAGVRTIFAGDDAPILLPVDPLRLRQVLINLLGNAIKFSRGRGAVTVGVRATDEGAEFSVRDEGIGIARENLDKVFGSFQQVHAQGAREFGGTGLGLSIARSLVVLHGGDMWVESELGKGACFSFRIPKQVPERPPEDAASSERPVRRSA